MMKWLKYALVALVILLLDTWLGLSWFKKIGARVFQPIRGKIYEMKVDKGLDENKLGELVLEGEVEKLRSENNRLREVLETPLDPSWQFIPAKILRLDKGEVRIDAGSKEGVKEGQVVVVVKKKEFNNGVLIGRVGQVYAYESVVSLLENEEVKVKMSNGVEGEVGLVEEELRVKKVLQKESLVKGDLVTTLGGDGWLPDLVVGRVGEVYKQDEAVFKTAKIELGVDVAQVIEVMVVGS